MILRLREIFWSKNLKNQKIFVLPWSPPCGWIGQVEIMQILPSESFDLIESLCLLCYVCHDLDAATKSVRGHLLCAKWKRFTWRNWHKFNLANLTTGGTKAKQKFFGF